MVPRVLALALALTVAACRPVHGLDRGDGPVAGAPLDARPDAPIFDAQITDAWLDARLDGRPNVPIFDAQVADAHGAPDAPGPSTDADAGLQISLHVTGVGAAEIIDETNYAVTYCIDDCTLSGQAGDLIHATAYAPIGFAGWSGPCTGSDPNCTFTLTGPTPITAAFAASSSAFLRPGGLQAQAAVVTPAGKLALCIGGTLELLDSDGSVIWSTSAGGGGLAGIAVDDAGNLYVGGSGLTKVSPDGALLWSVPGGGSSAELDEYRDMVAVSPDGSHVLYWNMIYDGDGTFVTHISLPFSVLGVAADRTGGFYIATEAASGPDETDAHHFDSAGTEIGPTIVVPGYNVMLAVDTLDRLWAASSGHSMFWFTRDGELIYDDDGGWPSDTPCGIAADWSGGAIPTHDPVDYGIAGQYAGVPLATNQDGDIGGIIPQAIAAGPGYAVAGTLVTPNGGSWEWIDMSSLHP